MILIDVLTRESMAEWVNLEAPKPCGIIKKTKQNNPLIDLCV